VGLPGVLLWGETAVEIWRPPSEKMIVLRHPAGLAQLPVETVLTEVRQMIGVFPGETPPRLNPGNRE